MPLDISKYIRFFLELPSFLKDTMSFDESMEIIKERLKNREENFLKLLKKGIFENKKSPYLKLFKLSRCGYEDVERMVRRDGLEAALHSLREDGVYLSLEEFKGKRAVERRGVSFEFTDRDFINPCITSFYRVKSGGSRSLGTKTEINLEFLKKRSVYYPLMIKMFGLEDSALGIWFPGPPLGAGLIPFLQFAKAGKVADKWFTPTQLYFSRKIGLRIMSFIMSAQNKRFPYPQYTSIAGLHHVLDWMSGAKRSHKGLVFLTYPSLAVRICELAAEKKIDIANTKFWLVGEPISEAKAGVIQSQMCSIIPIYAFMELGLLAFGCPDRQYVESVHLAKDTLAMIQHKRYIPALSTHLDVFLFSSIMPSSPKILLNIENGDYGIVDKKPCGCIAGEIGLDIQIRDIQSFEKLNAEGMTLFVSDFIPILENILPKKFGGGPLDYQLFEEETQTRTVINLIVSPRVGNIDEGAVIAVILSELRKKTNAASQMAELLSDAGAFKVKRAHPQWTQGSKIYPLFIDAHKRGEKVS